MVSSGLRSAEYLKALNNAKADLENDFVSGARQMADKSLSQLRLMFELASQTAETKDELWELAVSAAKRLAGARPSMSAAITSALLRTLQGIRTSWEQTASTNITITEFSSLATQVIARQIESRREASAQLGHNFTSWLTMAFPPKPTNSTGTKPVKILTLSNSSTIRGALISLVTSPSSTDLKIDLTVLESRPRFEGADLVGQLLASLTTSIKDRLSVQIAPDCAMATVIKDIDVILLGADRIRADSGDVSNKIGSLGVVACARVINPDARVVVLSEGDKIVSEVPNSVSEGKDGEEEEEVEIHDNSEVMNAWGRKTQDGIQTYVGEEKQVRIFSEWFEWVPGDFIGVYVTERGFLGREDVKGVGREIEVLRKDVFGSV